MDEYLNICVNDVYLYYLREASSDLKTEWKTESGFIFSVSQMYQVSSVIFFTLLLLYFYNFFKSFLTINDFSGNKFKSVTLEICRAIQHI